MQKPIVMSWDLVTRASVRDTWAMMSDTDRFNRVAEAGFSFASEPDGRVLGTITKLGLTIQWDEQPFSYRAPRWFRVVRAFHSGPAERLVASCVLTPEGRGTRIAYRLDVTPRGFFTRAILGFDLKATTERKVGAALALLVAALDDEAARPKYDGAAPQLTPAAEKRLAEGIAALGSSPYALRLAAFLRAAPERDQARISASTLAYAWRAQLDDVVDVLLGATEAGVLAMSLDLLCPACQVPRREASAGVGQVHCEACGIRYDATFPELCAVHFKPSPELRTLAVKTECIGSPAQSAHILAQETLEPGEETDLATELEPGMHQLRTLPALGPPALVEVSLGGHPQEASFRVGNMIHPQVARTSAPRSLRFANGSDRRVVVILERVTRPPQLVTAGRLYADFPRFRQLAPVLPFFGRVECVQTAVLALLASEPRALPAALPGAKLVYASDRSLFATYATLEALLADARASGLLSGSWAGVAGASVGITFEVDRDGRRVPMGSAVDEAYAVMQGASFGSLTLPERLVAEPTTSRALEAQRFSAVQHPYPASDGQRIVRVEPAP